MESETKLMSLTPPNLIKSLREGFDAIANHIELIIFPFCLDLFLWLGPHLRITSLVEEMLQAMLQFSNGEQTDLLRLGEQFWHSAAERINLFALLRTYPVGIFSLMAGIQPIETPFGKPFVLQASSLAFVLLIWIILSLIGIIAGTIFFSAVAQAALEGKLNWLELISRWIPRSIQVIFLSIFWMAILAMVSLPASCMISLLAFGNTGASQFGILVMMGILVWIFFPLLFSPHGIFVNKPNMWLSLRESVRLTRFTFPTTALLFLAVLVINQGLDIIWRMPKETSWLMAIGIAGHGFVTSGLLAATFIYYRDATQWVERMLQQIKLTSLS